MALFQGELISPEGRFALVAARFNWFIVEQLLSGAVDGFVRHGVDEDRLDKVLVPGSLEIPLVAKRLATRRDYSAIVCLGAVIRGETHHFDVVANDSARGIAQASIETGVPIINAVLTTNTVEQAVNRAGAKAGNKGFEAALAAIEMANLLQKLG